MWVEKDEGSGTFGSIESHKNYLFPSGIDSTEAHAWSNRFGLAIYTP